MITETVTVASEYVASLGLDAVKKRFKEKIDEKKLRSVLTSYIEKQKKYHEICTLAEEIDFHGLVEYMQINLVDATSTRVFDPNPKMRGQARQMIVCEAIAYSKANTTEAKRRVTKCINNCLDIIREFYESEHFSLKDYLLAGRIVDVVGEEMHESTMTTVAAVNDAKNQILAKIAKDGSLFSVDKAVEYAESGNVGVVGLGIKKVLDHISLTHPLAPDFGYDYWNGMIVSKPLTEKAKVFYPPKIILSGAVKIGGEYYNDPYSNPLNYAYRHQLLITMEVSKAEKMLGEKPDPIQDEVKGLVGNTVSFTPPEFPPAFPCVIRVGDKPFFDSVLLRTQEIEDDGTYVISNKEQGGSFYFEVRINPKKPRKPDFTINMRNAKIRERLNFVKFVSALSREKELHIYVLSQGEDIIAGYINGFDYKTGFSSTEEEIDFLERICVIEDYFNVRLSPCGEISNSEYNSVFIISDLIRNEQVTGTWNEFAFTGEMSQHFRKELTTLDMKQHVISYVGVIHVNLFGAEFEFQFMRTFKCATVVDIEKIRRKAEVLDDGDSIRITFRAGDDKTVIDTLRIPERFDRVQ
jgi:hypothetical protein